jgi:hypothetical protein
MARLRAAAALASYAKDSSLWTKVQDRVTKDLVNVPPLYLEAWMTCFRDVSGKLQETLTAIYRDAKLEKERMLATEILAHYFADEPKILAVFEEEQASRGAALERMAVRFGDVVVASAT